MKKYPKKSSRREASHILSKSTLSKCTLAVAISSLLPVWTHAEEELKQLPTVQVESEAEDDYKVERPTSHKYTQPLLDTPKTITVIPKSLMQDRGVENLRDALRNVPGISLSAGEGGVPTGDSMSIRGFDARTDILIDGIRDIAGYTRDIYNLEAVEVAKGPGSAISGRGATGGLVNLQTKSARLDDISEISLSLGTESDYRTALDTNKTLGDSIALRVNLLADDGDVAGRDEVNNSKQAAAVAFAAGLETRSRFHLNAEIQKQDNLPDYGLPWVSAGQGAYADGLEDNAGKAPNADYGNFYGNVYRDFEDIDAHSVTARYELDTSERTTLRAQARVGSVERQSVVSAPRFLSIATSTDVRLSDEKTRDTKNTLAVVQLDLLGRYQTGAVRHDLVAGAEFAREKEQRWDYDDLGTDNLDTTPEVVDLYNPNPRVPYEGHYRRIGDNTEATGETNAVYVFDTLTFNPNWELTLGARWETFTTEYQYSYTDPSLVIEAEDDLFSWNAGLVYKPTENGSIYLGVGNSFNPSAEDLTAATNGNQNDLDPEEAISYELGTKWELFDGQVLTSAALFRTEKTNARTDAPDGAFGNDDGRFETLNGEQRVDGLELSAVGEVNENLSLTAAYTYQRSEVVSADADDAVQIGQPLPRTPKHSASVWISYSFSENWQTGVGAQYIGKRYNSSDPVGRETADAYTTLDAMVAYNLTGQFRIQLTGSNLTDEQYEDQLGGGHFIPGEGRHVRLSGSYSF